jgi:hypothetical protein
MSEVPGIVSYLSQLHEGVDDEIETTILVLKERIRQIEYTDETLQTIHP